MKLEQFLYLSIVAVCLSVGQVLFKLAAREIQRSPHDLLELTTSFLNWPMASALILYSAAALLWVYVLGEVPLSRAFPFTSLAFALVPILSWVIFGDTFNVMYLMGLGIIFIGICVVAIS